MADSGPNPKSAGESGSEFGQAWPTVGGGPGRPGGPHGYRCGCRRCTRRRLDVDGGWRRASKIVPNWPRLVQRISPGKHSECRVGLRRELLFPPWRGAIRSHDHFAFESHFHVCSETLIGQHRASSQQERTFLRGSREEAAYSRVAQFTCWKFTQIDPAPSGGVFRDAVCYFGSSRACNVHPDEGGLQERSGARADSALAVGFAPRAPAAGFAPLAEPSGFLEYQRHRPIAPQAIPKPGPQQQDFGSVRRHRRPAPGVRA